MVVASRQPDPHTHRGFWLADWRKTTGGQEDRNSTKKRTTEARCAASNQDEGGAMVKNNTEAACPANMLQAMECVGI